MSATTVNVKVYPKRGPARASFSVELEIHFDPSDTEQAGQALRKVWEILHGFGSAEEVEAIRREFMQELNRAAAEIS